MRRRMRRRRIKEMLFAIENTQGFGKLPTGRTRPLLLAIPIIYYAVKKRATTLVYLCA